jgi:hypothetical protein
MSYSTMMTKGAMACHWTTKKKEEPPKEKPKKEAVANDPAKC